MEKAVRDFGPDRTLVRLTAPSRCGGLLTSVKPALRLHCRMLERCSAPAILRPCHPARLGSSPRRSAAGSLALDQHGESLSSSLLDMDAPEPIVGPRG